MKVITTEGAELLAGLPGPMRLVVEHVIQYPTAKNKAFAAGYAEGWKRGKGYVATLSDDQMRRLLRLLGDL